MSKTEHTPGPWTVTRSKMATDGAFDYAISAGAIHVLAEAFGRDADGGWPPAEANARLIAAAPEMLAALKALADECDRIGNALSKQGIGATALGLLTNKARTAISRATGQAGEG